MFACLHGPGNLKALAAEFSPIVELTAADTVTFDISGLDRLFGLPQEIAAAILRRAAERSQVDGRGREGDHQRAPWLHRPRGRHRRDRERHHPPALERLT